MGNSASAFRLTTTVAVLVLLPLLANCSRQPRESRQAQESKLQSPAGEVQPAPLPPRPRATIDPKSSEAAEDLVRGFIRLVNEGRLGDAYMLLGPNAPPRTEFEQQWRAYSNLHVTSGHAGAQDGAAGSIYVSVPLTISGRRDGNDVRRSATAVLRRVNDVPGSTDAQRRWHIERIELEK